VRGTHGYKICDGEREDLVFNSLKLVGTWKAEVEKEKGFKS